MTKNILLSTVIIALSNISVQLTLINCKRCQTKILLYFGLASFAIYQVYGIAGHRKGEVNHVGGLTKATVQRETSAWRKLKKSESIVNFLEEKFGNKSDPSHIFKNIDSENIEEERDGERSRKYITVD